MDQHPLEIGLRRASQASNASLFSMSKADKIIDVGYAVLLQICGHLRQGNWEHHRTSHPGRLASCL